MPAVLIETGFLNNRYDVERLVDDAKRTALVRAIRDGIDSHFGYRRKPGDEQIKFSGHVYDSADSSKYLAGIFVVAEQVGSTRTATTNDKGYFEFKLPKFGKWNLFFSDPREKYLRTRSKTVIECFDTVTNNIALKRNPIIIVPPINQPPPIKPPPLDSNVSGVVIAENSVPIAPFAMNGLTKISLKQYRRRKNKPHVGSGHTTTTGPIWPSAGSHLL